MSLDEWLQTPGGADVHPDDVEKLWAFEDRGSSSYDLEVRVRKGDGSFRWFLIRFRERAPGTWGPGGMAGR
jgi:PAS domain-containing protein